MEGTGGYGTALQNLELDMRSMDIFYPAGARADDMSHGRGPDGILAAPFEFTAGTVLFENTYKYRRDAMANRPGFRLLGSRGALAIGVVTGLETRDAEANTAPSLLPICCLSFNHGGSRLQPLLDLKSEPFVYEGLVSAWLLPRLCRCHRACVNGREAGSRIDEGSLYFLTVFTTESDNSLLPHLGDVDVNSRSDGLTTRGDNGLWRWTQSPVEAVSYRRRLTARGPPRYLDLDLGLGTLHGDIRWRGRGSPRDETATSRIAIYSLGLLQRNHKGCSLAVRLSIPSSHQARDEADADISQSGAKVLMMMRA
ncbi:hypothetical protein G7046_g4716 [Stylonectria norvegica]|nr:hypothetical protein G7046_g4716 [Stylonectria norvegica]